MSISLRSIKGLMRRAAPDRKTSAEGARFLRSHLERTAEELTLHASRIHDRENAVRAQVGERPRAILAEKHLKMALEGKFPELRFKEYDDSKG